MNIACPGYRPFLRIGSSRLSPSSPQPAHVPPPTRPQAALQRLAIRLLQCTTRPSRPSAQMAATLRRPPAPSRSSTVSGSTPAHSYAAVTLLRVHPTGSMVDSTPAPAIQVCSSVFHSTVPSTPLLNYPGQHLPFSGSVFLTNSEMASVLICYLRNSWAWWALLENPAQSANTQTILLHGSHLCLNVTFHRCC